MSSLKDGVSNDVVCMCVCGGGGWGGGCCVVGGGGGGGGGLVIPSLFRVALPEEGIITITKFSSVTKGNAPSHIS